MWSTTATKATLIISEIPASLQFRFVTVKNSWKTLWKTGFRCRSPLLVHHFVVAALSKNQNKIKEKERNK